MRGSDNECGVMQESMLRGPDNECDVVKESVNEDP